MKNRKEKIEFLRGLATGQRNIKELEPPPEITLVVTGGGDPPIYKETKSGRTLTPDEEAKYKERVSQELQRNPTKFKVKIIQPSDGV